MTTDMVKPKPSAYEVVPDDSATAQEVYPVIRDLINSYHPALRQARIRLAWKSNWSEDAEGNTPIAKLKLVPELFYRFLDSEEDPAPAFIVLLNRNVWGHLEAKDRAYVLDEALSAGDTVTDKNDEHHEDDTGRELYRLRKPDFSGFAGPIARHGARTPRIKRFLAQLAGAGGQLRLFKGADHEGEVLVDHDELAAEEAAAAAADEDDEAA